MFELIPMALAQATAVDPVSPIGGLYDLLLNNGVLGGAVAVLIFLLIRRDRDLQNSQEGRLTDAKSMAEMVKNHTAAMVASNAAAEERNRALEVASRAAEKSALIIEQLTKEISELKAQIRGK